MVDRQPIKFERDTIQFKATDGKKKLSSTINMANVSASPIIFKIKTTTHDRYAVKPSTGIIEPNGNFSVSIMLLVHEISDITSINDKFQVQYLSTKEATAFSWSEDKITNEFKQGKGKELKQNFNVQIMNENGKVINVSKSSTDKNRDIGLKGKIQPNDKVIFESTYNKNIQEINNENTSSCLVSGVNNQKQLDDMKNEKNKMEQELAKLRNQIANNSSEKPMTQGGFKLWQTVLCMVFALVIGNFLSTSAAVPLN